ncbi:acetyltransferase, GNAT family [Phenylobacterium zucineum HLK1]|uniref:Acetyltransferase, GNAT family n=1 Tax=Phenylobacterium zucineum (strain HLK1) TaxID=450851 RepID=B4R8W5_PHEZH|nr:GNAT family N-acetyltransferase [Phenylobacterium zucineum]ACG79330.1 acetyltransferase, GNAT family [Phenylobacterium zucineum HLK1]
MSSDSAIRLRPGRASDIDAVREIERVSADRFRGTPDAWIADDEPTAPQLLAERAAQGALIVACEADDAPVASIIFRPVEDGLYIEQVDVLPSHAGRRIGAALIDAVADAARARGASALTLSTFRDVPWNAPWYARLGFEVLDVLTPGLAAIRAAHEARGLDESRRVFMRRPVL